MVGGDDATLELTTDGDVFDLAIELVAMKDGPADLATAVAADDSPGVGVGTGPLRPVWARRIDPGAARPRARTGSPA